MSRTEIVESIVMLFCIVLLWPVVRSMRGGPPVSPLFKVVLVVAVVVLAVITVRRVKRIRQAFGERDGRRGPPFPPGA